MFNRIASHLGRRAGLTSLFMAVAVALPLAGTPAAAQTQNLSPEDRIEMAVNDTYIGYISTGNPSLDPVTEAGLNGLGFVLHQRTNAENIRTESGADVSRASVPTTPVRGMALDLERDELSLYPIIYWAVDPLQADFSQEAIRRLNDYTRNGGLLVIDTRDGNQANGRGIQKVRRMAELGLNIPPLVRVQACDREPCSLIGRTHYLLKDFPGRERGGQLWMENASELRHDGVPSVILGHNDWAAAWAIDGSGRYVMNVPDTGNQREHAFRFGINLMMAALTGRYKDDPVHTQQIYERVRP